MGIFLNTGGAHDFVQIVYISRMLPGLRSAEIEAMRQKSLANNVRDRVTGILFLHGDMFIGLLEGEETVTLSTMERVSRDARHKDLKILRETGARTRRFDNWDLHRVEGPGFRPSQVEEATTLAYDLADSLRRVDRKRA